MQEVFLGIAWHAIFNLQISLGQFHDKRRSLDDLFDSLCLYSVPVTHCIVSTNS